MIPDDPEDAALAMSPEELEHHPAIAEYYRELSSILHGQAPHGRHGRTLRPADELASERVEKARRERAHANRLAAIRPTAEPIPF